MDKFTPRELELLKYLKTSLINKEIAYKMGITEKTVKIMNTKLYKKLKIKRRIDIYELKGI
jgi:DNA-binding NarL/FixJ family response regulator